MRIYEGDYAYEIERIIDPATQLASGWRYNLYRIRPADELLSSGRVATREEAEKAGKNAMSELIEKERYESLREERTA